MTDGVFYLDSLCNLSPAILFEPYWKSAHDIWDDELGSTSVLVNLPHSRICMHALAHWHMSMRRFDSPSKKRHHKTPYGEEQLGSN